MARKSKYFTHVKPKLHLIECWCRDGDLEETICKKLGVGVSTFAVYKNKYQELQEALKNGKQEIDYQVENALLKRAMGFSYQEKTYEKEWNQQLGKYINVNTKTVTKQVSPDTTAQIFWLKNRKPKVWRDKQHIEHEGSIAAKEYTDMTDEELEVELKNRGLVE